MLHVYKRKKHKKRLNKIYFIKVLFLTHGFQKKDEANAYKFIQVII